MRRDSPLSRLRATRPLISRLLVVVLLATLSACSGDDNGANDSGANDSGASDSAIDGAARDAAPADSSLADGALPSTCAGACAEQALEAIFSTTTEGFERAIYGIDTTGAQPTLYLEALSGGFSGCPKQDSPTPDRSLLITGLRLPSSGTLSEADGVTITLLDYRGTLLPAKPLSKATKITEKPIAATPQRPPHALREAQTEQRPGAELQEHQPPEAAEAHRSSEATTDHAAEQQLHEQRQKQRQRPAVGQATLGLGHAGPDQRRDHHEERRGRAEKRAPARDLPEGQRAGGRLTDHRGCSGGDLAGGGEGRIGGAHPPFNARAAATI